MECEKQQRQDCFSVLWYDIMGSSVFPVLSKHDTWMINSWMNSCLKHGSPFRQTWQDTFLTMYLSPFQNCFFFFSCISKAWLFFSTLFVLAWSINNILHCAFVCNLLYFMSHGPLHVTACSEMICFLENSGALGNISSVCENRNSIKKTQPPTIISKLDGRLEQYNHAIEVNYLRMCLYNVNFIVRLFAYIPVNTPAQLFCCFYIHFFTHAALLTTPSAYLHLLWCLLLWSHCWGAFGHPACPGTSSISHMTQTIVFLARPLVSCHLTVRKCVKAPWQMCV